MNWPEYLMGFAEQAARKSKDSTKVGAVLVTSENVAILTGYNGPPRGVKDKPERFERPVKYLYASHAEANLIAHAARHGIRTDGCSVYVSHQPCASCMRTLIQAGIKRVVFGAGTFQAMDAERSAVICMSVESGAELLRYKDGITERLHYTEINKAFKD